MILFDAFNSSGVPLASEGSLPHVGFGQGGVWADPSFRRWGELLYLFQGVR
jgi:hypothetical protein